MCKFPSYNTTGHNASSSLWAIRSMAFFFKGQLCLPQIDLLKPHVIKEYASIKTVNS